VPTGSYSCAMGGWNKIDVTTEQNRDAAGAGPATLPCAPSRPYASASAVAAPAIKYRLWFICFAAWLVALALAARWGSYQIDHAGSAAGWAVWMLSLTALYLSLCCSFIPAPTTWIVLLAASDMIAAQVGIAGHGPARMVIVATVCAIASSLANLNEYHIVAYLVNHHRLARIRQTRLYMAASGWFRKSPFWILMLFSFVPIPVDVIRWLAVLARYDRGKFFVANFVGRWFRYALCAVVSLGLDLTPRQILVIQAVLVGVAAMKFLLQRLRGKRNRRDTGLPDATLIVDGARQA
jgi:membrane protein YqaA with SNARE-associated domain